MTTLADSLVNSATRPLRLRKRPDLVERRNKYHGKSYWILKDPVGLNYFRFHDEEYAILSWLDGVRSLESIREQFQREFAPQRISLQELQQFVGMLHRNALVISDSGGQGRQLRRRADTKRRREIRSKLANLLALRFRGIDPERILTAILPAFGWLFTAPAIIAALVFGLASLLLVFINWTTFSNKLPGFEQFFAAENWLALGATMAAVKVLHEFGHGLSCKKYGGECHEMGVMLLVFTPCLYCNVSDSWMLPSKWQRVMIGAAGMYVELILASIATWVWWYSEPGLVNFLALSIMFLCSVSTVLFNGNPLLRFDGYYILMDILEIPNLRQKSSETLKQWFQKTCLGLKVQENPFLPQRNRFWFGIFTVASSIYRWVVVFGIIWFLNQVLKPYGLQSIGRAVAVASVVGMFAAPTVQIVKFFRTPGKVAQMKPKRILITSALAAAVIGFVAFVPLPFHVDAAFEIQPQDAYHVRVIEPGQMGQWYRRPGSYVRAGQAICQLRNLELEAAAASAQTEFDVHSVRLQQMERQANIDPSQARLISSQRQLLESAAEQLGIAQSRVKNLTIVARRDGVIIEPPLKTEQGSETDQLPGWTGSPFSLVNRQAYYAESDLLCFVADPGEMEAVMLVDQFDVELLKVGQPVEIMLYSARLNSLQGRIESIATADVQEAPQSLASQAGGAMEMVADENGRMRPLSTAYQARVAIESDHVPLRPGYRGDAKIHLDWKPLGWRLARFVTKTFKFDF